MPSLFIDNERARTSSEVAGARSHEGVLTCPGSVSGRKSSDDQRSDVPELEAKPEPAADRPGRRGGRLRTDRSDQAEAPPRQPRRARTEEARLRRRLRRDRSRARAEGEGRARSSRSAASSRSGRNAAATSRQRRRREPQRRAPLPAAKRELLVSVDVGERRVAILEDSQVAEVYLERPERRSIAGNIYLGRVDNVLPGMEAAFVEIGLEKNGFLYVDEIVSPELEKGHGRKIQDLISRGQTILVQAVKDPMKTKGARLTTQISLPGRFVVLVPQGEGLGVSRRLDDDERNRLKDILKRLDVKEGGVIVRTAAEGASEEDIERDLVFLQRLWRSIQAKAKDGEGAGAPLPGGRAAAARRPRPLHRRLREGVRRRRAHVPAPRRLPEEDVAAHGRAGRPLQGEDAADGGVRRRAGDQVDDRPPRRSPLRRLPHLRLRRGVHRHRRQHRPLRRRPRQELGQPARGHDHEEQPRGREGGRPPAAAARHRRDHRHRLHRHGQPEEPGDRRGGAAHGARARPDEDVRRRDLAARPRRDDAPERDRRPARGDDAQVPDLRRRRDRLLRGVGGDRRRAAAARARRGLAVAGVPGRARRRRSRARSSAPAPGGWSSSRR